MTSPPNTNPLFQLLRQLPKSVAKPKRRHIKMELESIGKWQHYRQCVLRSDWKLGDTHIAVANVLIRILGVSRHFFTASPEEQQQEINRIVAYYQPK